MMSMNVGGNLEYMGAHFVYDSYSSKVEGRSAEECLERAKSFVRDLNSEFKKMLTETVDAVLDWSKKCNLGEQILDGYKK